MGRRQVGAGLKCMRLPDHYEVVDAELAGMLMVLKEVTEKPHATAAAMPADE